MKYLQFMLYNQFRLNLNLYGLIHVQKLSLTCQKTPRFFFQIRAGDPNYFQNSLKLLLFILIIVSRVLFFLKGCLRRRIRSGRIGAWRVTTWRWSCLLRSKPRECRLVEEKRRGGTEGQDWNLRRRDSHCSGSFQRAPTDGVSQECSGGVSRSDPWESQPSW